MTTGEDPSGIPETTYGFRKRLKFCVSAISQHAPLSKRAVEDVRILDLGCGTGDLLAFPLARLGYRVTGVDPDEASIARARERPSSADSQNPEYVLGTIDTLPPSKAYDVLICSEVLEHVLEPLQLLLRVRRCLTPEGLLIVTVPNGFGPFEWDVLVRDLARSIRRTETSRPSGGPVALAADKDSLAVDCRHVNFFTFPDLVSLLETAGFSCVRSQNRTILCGPYSDRLAAIAGKFGLGEGFSCWNARAADWFPRRLVSDWMVVAVPERQPTADRFSMQETGYRRLWADLKRRTQKTP